ncbi:unnamed protein product [Trichogramma brassicae]|uniref:Integrase catalytic domain-containing protein n=1 Tax=Trichogramma brassicae TaxID=86971 RepID=A0A6H5IU59_9HYME|nr:unnamed protein product [Trichogramma brassicae]
MSFCKEWFSNYVKLKNPFLIKVGDGKFVKGIGTGDIHLEAYNGRVWNQITLKDVLYTPETPFNLFSVSSMLDKGYTQSADAKMSVFKNDQGCIIVRAVRAGKLFKMDFRQETTDQCLVSMSIIQWHEKLAHQHVKHVKNILNRNGITYSDDWNNYVCEGCVYGKQHRASHQKTAKETLELVHVDLGEMDVRSLGGAKYFLLFKDDYSHYKTVYLLKTKDEAVAKLKAYVKLVENQFGKMIKTLRSDHGTEIKNASAKEIMDSLGIFHSKSSTYTPQQNGRIEREIRTVVEATRSVIHARNLDTSLWGEAMNYVVHTLNQTGTSSVANKSPADLWFGRRLNVNKLRTFGCDSYVFIEEVQRVTSTITSSSHWYEFHIGSLKVKSFPDFHIYILKLDRIADTCLTLNVPIHLLCLDPNSAVLYKFNGHNVGHTSQWNVSTRPFLLTEIFWIVFI